ncbi:hypothetical protein [Kibdelosporangium aridum]|uniref:hypothetical protein n=1 Tax=Kibdelosporangium aridum TaxID=2030 RepID=UPI000568EAA1|nr:hypothetical protein [Kibdelosporangium aridum]
MDEQGALTGRAPNPRILTNVKNHRFRRYDQPDRSPIEFGPARQRPADSGQVAPYGVEHQTRTHQTTRSRARPFTTIGLE